MTQSNKLFALFGATVLYYYRGCMPQIRATPPWLERRQSDGEYETGPLPPFSTFVCCKSCPVTWAAFYFIIGVVSVAKLTEKQKRFVAEYLVDLNATQAAIRAGYSPKTANRIGSQNLSKVDVQAEIEKRRATLRNKLEITQEKVIEELAAVAFANGADFAQVTKTGLVRIIPTEDIPQDKRKAIASIKEGANGTEIKTYDKVRALELLGKHLGVFDSNNGVAAEQENNIFDVIDQSTREELDTSAISEIEHPAKPGNDLVE